ncbi:MAG: aminotransferase class I/II-fold pyridoxal phosphate-dependent enzyme [bacterium]|nr:aminotransferase class I/II-fold pyridoxal phosphate-dependent enzyme [bacterium]
MKIENFLEARRKRLRLRELYPATQRKEGDILINDKWFINLSSNDYLGLSSHPRLKTAAKNCSEIYGVSTSSSRLQSGDNKLHHKLEEDLALFLQKEASLTFASGYQTNVGVIPAICKKGDAIFLDRLAHASIVDGARLSGAKIFRFRHNDVDHLEWSLKKNRKDFETGLIITEALFSMEGDTPPICKILLLKESFSCLLMVDEAHSIGVLGERGAGLCEDNAPRIELLMGTFSKAIGGFGGYVACSSLMKDYLINSCRSFIYSTAPPLPVIAANIEGIKIIKKEPERRKVLLAKARYLKEALLKNGIATKGDFQILSIIFGDEKKTIDYASFLQEEGFWLQAIRPPTVPENECRIRLSVNFYHSQEALDRLVRAIARNS